MSLPFLITSLPQTDPTQRTSDETKKKMERRPSSSAHTVDLASPGLRRRRSFTSAASEPSDQLAASVEDGPPSKARKVSRACDFCKSRKAKCSGHQPCTKCVAKGRNCLYNAKYTRGRPPTPPPSASAPHAQTSFTPAGFLSTPNGYGQGQPRTMALRDEEVMDRAQHQSTGPASRASPELGMAEIQGQVFDPTSGLTFLHKAWKRLSAQNANSMPDVVKTSAENQPVTMAGDRPLPESHELTPIRLPSPSENRMLLALYFDVCIATYRFLYRPAVEKWLAAVEKNLEENRPVWHEIGHARAAIVLVALAIATTHNEKSKGFFSADDEMRALSLSDELFGISYRLTEMETGYPKLESAQARLVQVLYLLTTSRFNKSWYVFGNALQIISTIGLHRKENSKRRRASKTDYIHAQCRMRTFWTAYVLDNYLGVVFGRPRHYHDDDIDQSYPDRVNDEDMTALGPSDTSEEPEDSHIDALIFHAKIAQIIGSISRDVYTIKDISEHERVAAANRHIQRINEWRSSLPLHLGSIRPSMLIPSYRRQATVLKLAHSHAVMHASRLFILGNSTNSFTYADDCIAAAKTVLESVDHMARDGPIFHAFWWTHYVTFCALVVIYVWEIQQRRTGRPFGLQHDTKGDHRARLLELADRCQGHLAKATATNSPSRRYAVILEEFRTAATRQPQRQDNEQPGHVPLTGPQPEMTTEQGAVDEFGQIPGGSMPDQHMMLDPHLLDEWQTTDWLELDSSAFWPQVDFLDESMVWPGIA